MLVTSLPNRNNPFAKVCSFNKKKKHLSSVLFTPSQQPDRISTNPINPFIKKNPSFHSKTRTHLLTHEQSKPMHHILLRWRKKTILSNPINPFHKKEPFPPLQNPGHIIIHMHNLNQNESHNNVSSVLTFLFIPFKVTILIKLELRQSSWVFSEFAKQREQRW
jgi:hypothetical protein